MDLKQVVQLEERIESAEELSKKLAYASNDKVLIRIGETNY